MKILTFPHPILRKKTKKVTDFSEIKGIAKEMEKLMERNQGIGLAANQVGLDFSFFIAKPQKKLYIVVNPKIVEVSEEKEKMIEGCLSLPKILANVERPKQIVLEAFDEKGKKITLKAKGLLARVFLHETDHLNGILIIDRSKEIYKISEAKDLI